MAEAAAAATSIAAPATTTGGWTKHVTCRYFMHGLCKEGDNCRYSHDQSSSKSTMICKFFQKGCCAFGDRCRFEHIKPAKQEELPGPMPSVPLPAAPLTLADDPGSMSSGPASTSKAQEKPHSFGGVDWVNAAEFVPGQPYCGRDPVIMDGPGPLIEDEYEKEQTNKELKKQLCPYAAVGECRYGLNCAYLHGDVCDMCGLQALHPSDTAQRSQHIRESDTESGSEAGAACRDSGESYIAEACIEAHEKDMEISFAIQRSKDMMCGVCMEVVFEKANPSERRFGILSNCNHCYCLKCIRKWRSAKQFESKIIKSCPECRITSNFVIPSEYWVEDKEEKQNLIQKYKDGMGSKPCRYFDEGRGTCPFGANCFYKHAFPDGRLEEPQPQSQNQRRQNGSNTRNRGSRRTPLWDLFDERESNDSLDNDDEEMVTFELSEMLLMLLAARTEDDITDSEDEWDLFHEELDNYYDLYL